MTVCLACVSKKHNIMAFCSDRMVTSAYPPIEFEHKIPKIVEINEYCVAMSAGNALISKELFDYVGTKIQGQHILVKDIAYIVTSIYQEMRLGAAEDIILKSRGLTHDIFVDKGAEKLPQGTYQQIDHFLATFNFNLELIIAGLDEHGPTIYGIRNPGTVNCYDSIGFHAIGNGGLHAILSLVETYNPESTEAEMLYSVFRAKKVAEVAPGVGKEVDLGAISIAGKIKYFDENAELYKRIAKLFEDETRERISLITKSRLATMGNVTEPAKLSINTEKAVPKEE